MFRSLAFAVCLTAAASFEFLSIGDWGASPAKKVGLTMAKYDPEFALAIGDNFYSNGVKSVNDPQFKSKFEDTFAGKSLQTVPWYVTAGNHDWYGGTAGVSAEIQYTNHSTRWYFPDYYYSKVFTSKDGVTLEVISTDTWKINGGDTFVKFDPVSMKGVLRNKGDLTQALTDGRILQETHDQIVATFPEEDPLNPLTVNPDTAQLKWLTKTLAASKADWKIVQGHFPIHSCTTGEHGDTKSLITQMQPILEKGKADMYFSGHDHILQHIELNGVHYHGSGAGGMQHTGVNQQYKGLEGVAMGHYGFMRHNGTKSEMTTTFTLADGTMPYTYTLKKGAVLLN